MIEILIVSQLPTLHGESSNIFQGELDIFSREQGEIKDPVPLGMCFLYISSLDNVC